MTEQEIHNFAVKLFNITKLTYKFDRKEFIEGIEESLRENTFRFIYEKDICIGYFTFLEIIKRGKLFVYIGNFFILPRYRHNNNTLFLKNKFKEEFKDAYCFFWYSSKKKRYVYIKRSQYENILS